MKFTEIKKTLKSVATKEVEIAGGKVQVKQYLPSAQKYKIIKQAIGTCVQDGVVDHYVAEMIFNLFLVFEYTNITFTEHQKSEIFETYDVLERAGIIDAVIRAIPEVEYNGFVTLFQQNLASLQDYHKGVGELIKEVKIALNSFIGSNAVKDGDMEKLETIQHQMKELLTGI